MHLVRSSSVGQIGCTIGRSVSFPLSPFHGCVFQRLHARMMCMVLVGQPAPVTPLSFISQVQWVCLRQVSVFHPSAAGAPSFEHSGGAPAVPAQSAHQRMHMRACAHACALPLSSDLLPFLHSALPSRLNPPCFFTAQGRWPAWSVTSAFPAALGCMARACVYVCWILQVTRACHGPLRGCLGALPVDPPWTTMLILYQHMYTL